MLSIINIYRCRSIKSNVLIFSISNYIFFLFSIITVLESSDNDMMRGFYSVFGSGHAVGAIIFMFLYCTLK